MNFGRQGMFAEVAAEAKATESGPEESFGMV